jgi:hypothetical protein
LIVAWLDARGKSDPDIDIVVPATTMALVFGLSQRLFPDLGAVPDVDELDSGGQIGDE